MPALNLTCLFSLATLWCYNVSVFVRLDTVVSLSLPKCSRFLKALQVGQNCFSQHGLCMCVCVCACVRVCFIRASISLSFYTLYSIFYFLFRTKKPTLNCKAESSVKFNTIMAERGDRGHGSTEQLLF